MFYGLISLFFMGCGAEKEESTEEGTVEDQDWWDELEEEGQSSGEEDKEDYEDGDKEDYEDEDKEDYEDVEYEECEADFDSSESCEGTWQDTICMYDDLIWWCQDGAWMNEDEK